MFFFLQETLISIKIYMNMHFSIYFFLDISYGRWPIEERSQTSGGKKFDWQTTWYLIRSIGPDLFESNQWKWTHQRVITKTISCPKTNHANPYIFISIIPLGSVWKTKSMEIQLVGCKNCAWPVAGRHHITKLNWRLACRMNANSLLHAW